MDSMLTTLQHTASQQSPNSPSAELIPAIGRLTSNLKASAATDALSPDSASQQLQTFVNSSASTSSPDDRFADELTDQLQRFVDSLGTLDQKPSGVPESAATQLAGIVDQNRVVADSLPSAGDKQQQLLSFVRQFNPQDAPPEAVKGSEKLQLFIEAGRTIVTPEVLAPGGPASSANSLVVSASGVGSDFGWPEGMVRVPRIFNAGPQSRLTPPPYLPYLCSVAGPGRCSGGGLSQLPLGFGAGFFAARSGTAESAVPSCRRRRRRSLGICRSCC